MENWAQEKSTNDGQYKQLKDMLKANLWNIEIDINTWEDVTRERDHMAQPNLQRRHPALKG